jgi:hypothetical protein
VKEAKKYKKEEQVAAKDGMWIDVIAKHAYRFIYLTRGVRLQHIMAKNANQAHQLAAC